MKSIIDLVFWWSGFGCCCYVAIRAAAIITNAVWCGTMLTWMYLRRCDATVRGLQKLRLIAVLWKHEVGSVLLGRWPAVSWSINGYELKNPFGIPRKLRKHA